MLDRYWFGSRALRRLPSVRKLAPALLVACLTLTVIAGAKPAAGQQEPPDLVQTPFLIIDNGMHVGIIHRISVDQSGLLAATGSTDRSIRLWDVRTGRQLSKLHVPLGQGAVGAVLSVALSPDGRMLLATSLAHDSSDEYNQGAIYLFDVESGALRARLQGYPANFTHIAFAPDGQSFAAVLGAWGFRLWNARGQEIFQDRNLEDPIQWLTFGSDGRIATASQRGELRVYVRDGNTVLWVNSTNLPPGLVPYSLSYSPDDRWLAVGYANSPRVDVLDADSLEPVATFEAPGVEGPEEQSGNLGAVAWSTEFGQPWLYAAGTAQDADGDNLILAWPFGRSPQPVVRPVATDSITQLVGVPTGGVLFASSEPAWGRLAVNPATGEPEMVVDQRARKHDFRGVSLGRLAVSPDGETVHIDPGEDGENGLTFSLAQLSLLSAEAAGDMRRPTPTSETVSVQDWYASANPTLQGLPLELEPGERSLSADVNPSSTRVLLGTDYYLRLYDSFGQTIARRRLNAPAWGVAFVPERDIVVAALGDGTIRWYALTENLVLVELAGFFQHGESERWVAWTADGFFAHSSFGGEELIGYQLNGRRGAWTGQWVNFSQVYRLFFDPETVSTALSQPLTWPAIASRERLEQVMASLALPQVDLQEFCPLETMPNDAVSRGLAITVTQSATVPESDGGEIPEPGGAACTSFTTETRGFASAQDSEVFGTMLPPGTRAVRVRFSVLDTGGGVSAVDAFVDGRNVGRVLVDPEPTPGVGSPKQFDVDPPANAGSAGEAGPGTEAGADFSHSFVLPVYEGENRVSLRVYNDSDIFVQTDPVFFTVAEQEREDDRELFVLAVGINRYLPAIQSLNYAVADARSFAETVEERLPGDYERSYVTTLFDEEATTARIEAELSRLAEEAGPEDSVLIYLAGHGISAEDGAYYFVPANVDSPTDAAIREQALGHRTIVELLSRVVARNAFLFLDTCYAGAFDLAGPNNLANETGRYVLTASASVEEALDSYDNQNGVFAHAVLEALYGEAGAGRGTAVDALLLGVYVRDRVPELAAERQFSQSAVFKSAGGDIEAFPLAGLSIGSDPTTAP